MTSVISQIQWQDCVVWLLIEFIINNQFSPESFLKYEDRAGSRQDCRMSCLSRGGRGCETSCVFVEDTGESSGFSVDDRSVVSGEAMKAERTRSRAVTCSSSSRCRESACSMFQFWVVLPVPNPVPVQYQTIVISKVQTEHVKTNRILAWCVNNQSN